MCRLILKNFLQKKNTFIWERDVNPLPQSCWTNRLLAIQFMQASNGMTIVVSNF